MELSEIGKMGATNQLLYAIYEELVSINYKLANYPNNDNGASKPIESVLEVTEVTDNNVMSRKELINAVKEVPGRPNNYATLSNEKLREYLKR